MRWMFVKTWTCWQNWMAKQFQAHEKSVSYQVSVWITTLYILGADNIFINYTTIAARSCVVYIHFACVCVLFYSHSHSVIQCRQLFDVSHWTVTKRAKTNIWIRFITTIVIDSNYYQIEFLSTNDSHTTTIDF